MLDKILLRHKVEDFARQNARVLRRYESLAERLASRPDFEDYDSSPLAQKLYTTYGDKLEKIRREEYTSEAKSMLIGGGAGAVIGYFLVKGVKFVRTAYTGSIYSDNFALEFIPLEIKIGASGGYILGSLANILRSRYISFRSNDELLYDRVSLFVGGGSTNELNRLSNKHLGSWF